MKPHERAASETTKTCSKCGLSKPLSEYYRQKLKSGKVIPFAACKTCYKKTYDSYYQRNKSKKLASCKQRRAEKSDEIAEYMRRYYRENRERILDRCSQYRQDDAVRDRESERQKSRYKKNRDKIREQQRERSHTDPEFRQAVNERSRQHYLANKAAYAVKCGRRRAAKMQAIPSWFVPGEDAEFYKLAKWLTNKTGVKYVVDHDVPLVSKYVCGLHCRENLRVITEKENLRKFNRHEIG